MPEPGPEPDADAAFAGTGGVRSHPAAAAAAVVAAVVAAVHLQASTRMASSLSTAGVAGGQRLGCRRRQRLMVGTSGDSDHRRLGGCFGPALEVAGMSVRGAVGDRRASGLVGDGNRVGGKAGTSRLRRREGVDVVVVFVVVVGIDPWVAGQMLMAVVVSGPISCGSGLVERRSDREYAIVVLAAAVEGRMERALGHWVLAFLQDWSERQDGRASRAGTGV